MHEVDSMHVEEGALQALIDGESVPDEDRDHIDSCEECSRRLEELRFAGRRATAALESIDDASPWTDMPDTLREAARGAVTPIAAARGGSRRPARSVAAAAGLVFVLAAGAYAIPGSPVREFVDNAFFGGDQGPADPGPTRVAVEPVDGTVRVIVLGATSGLRITLSASDAPGATVSARTAQFGVGAGEISVTDAAGDLAIDLPLSADGTVVIDGVPVARSTGGSITLLPGADESPAVIVVETAG